MPKHIIPWRNTPHRIAAIALYRALLIQSRSLPFTLPKERDELQNLIRNRFKQAQHLQSPRLLKVNFEAGYEAVDHLDAAVRGDKEGRAYILDLLQRCPARVKQPKPKPLIPHRKKPKEPKDSQIEVKDEEPRVNLFDRPLPLEKLSGRRRVPVLVNANHVPFLRLKKPQPESLSRYIRQRIKQRQKWHDTRHQLDEELSIAKLEDHWDRLTGQNAYTPERTPLDNGREREPQWRHAIQTAHAEVESKLNAEREKYRVMAEKMQRVIDREQALYAQEKKERQETWKAKQAAGEHKEVNLDEGQITQSYQPMV